VILSGAIRLTAAESSPRPPLTGKPWVDMDYGPFLTASIEAPSPRTNIAYKGLAIRLPGSPDASSGAGAAVLFDTDLLRYAAGWTGEFVALKGVVFDGEHWAYPHIAGRAAFTNPAQPGWAHAGRYEDPREHPFGPLPRDWAKWRGLYMHGDRVVLHYTVGASELWEMPGLEPAGDWTVFSRTFQRGPATEEHEVQLVFEAGWRSRVLTRDRLTPGNVEDPANELVVVLEPPPLPPSTGDAGAPRAETGRVGQWTFERIEGDVAPAEDVGAGVWLLRGARSTATGHSGKGLHFDGQAQAVLRGGPAVEFLETDFSVAAWVRTSDDGTILALAPPTGNWVPDGKALFVRGGRLTFDVGWVGAVTSSRAVADGQWHHVAMTWTREDGRVTLFMDGQADGSAVLRPAGKVNGHEVRLGFTAPNFPASPWLRGELDEVRLDARALTPAEVATLAGVVAREDLLGLAVIGAPAGTRWVATGEGQVRLRLPPSANPARFKVLLGRGPRASLAAWATQMTQSPAPIDLAPLTRGGPARWPERLTTRGQLGTSEGPYAIDTLTTPDDNPWRSWLRFGGLDFFADDNRAALCTWNGDVWVVEGVAGDLARLTWQRVATGLFQPLGLKIVRDQIYVLGRDQITRLHDLNGDGEADWYENFNNDCMVSEHFHEFATDLLTDRDGNFYYLKCARHALPALHPHHGTLLKLPPDGSRLEVVARGFRAVNGLGVGPNGELTCVDNQGNWMPGNRLNWVEPGGWYGNQWAWNPDRRTTYDEPLAWMHNFVDRSGGSHRWVPDNRWGPLAGQLITISYGMGHILLVLSESVDGVRQGGVTRFPLEFETGVMRGVFHPGNGQLYLAGLYGWAGNKTRPGGVYRVRATGQPLHLPNTLTVAKDGLILGFTTPLDPASATDPGNYDVTCWNYLWTSTYGSPDLKRDGQEGRDRLRVQSATLAADQRSVFLELPGLTPVMQMHVVFRLRAADGSAVENFVHHTVHRLGARPGRDVLGVGALVRDQADETELMDARRGLVQRVERLDHAGEASGVRNDAGETPASQEARPREVGRVDYRRARLPALVVPPGTAPTPFLSPGRFRSTWSGHLELALNDERTFHLEGRGAATLRLNGVEVLRGEGPQLDGVASAPVSLRRGPNWFEVVYDSPENHTAELRLLWAEPGQPPEPVPPTAFVHELDLPALHAGETLRQGRGLFLRHQCVRCHQPQDPWPAGSAPELLRDAPALDGIASRLHAAWLAGYLANPGGAREDVLMPRVLQGSAATIERDARDLAAFLAGLKAPSSSTPPPPTTEDAVAPGRAHFDRLGCVACHVLEGEPRLPDDTRLSLAHVRAKWTPAALVQFLEDPARDHAWTRMPRFGSDPAEAAALAAFLLAQSDLAPAIAEAVSGNPERGSELVETAGCLNCHTLTGRSSRLEATSLARLARSDWRRGCVAAAEIDRGAAPDFGFTEAQREALPVFAAHDGLASLSRETPVEFAERQIVDLRCLSCHARDEQPDLWSRLTAARVPAVSAGYDDEEEASAGSVHLGRPELTWTGEKLRADWLRRLLAGELGYRTRSEAQGRMPAFPAYGAWLATGLAHEHGVLDRREPHPAPDAALAAAGRQLTGIEGGFGCVSCHDVGTQAALAGPDTATINFAFVADRLRPAYYWRYIRDPQRLRPGTMMPSFIAEDGSTPIQQVLEGNARRQFEAIWHYLRSLEGTAPVETPPNR
jgi:cytochrome c2